jgi:predicted flap endonuclease-1-like 5' DNA nuclease
VGPRLAKLLNELGVLRYDQIAAWTPEDASEVNRHLGSFAGRIDKDRWIEQAKLLAAHDVTGFEARFGKLDSAIS